MSYDKSLYREKKHLPAMTPNIMSNCFEQWHRTKECKWTVFRVMFLLGTAALNYLWNYDFIQNIEIPTNQKSANVLSLSLID